MRNALKALVAIVVLVAVVFTAASTHASEPEIVRYGDRTFLLDGDAMIPTSYVIEAGYFRVAGEATNFPPATWDNPATIDRLWPYNDEAIEAIGSEEALLEKFRECTAYNNSANMLSRIWVHYRDTYRYAPYLESYKTMPVHGGEESLSWQWFQNPDFPAHADRDEVGADLVMFVRSLGGNFGTRPAEPDPESVAFIGVHSPCRTYAHENGGHNLGMDHNKEDEVFPSESDPYPYARGWHTCDSSSKSGHSTIMVAGGVSSCGEGYTTTAVRGFSSAGLKVNGLELGVPMADNSQIANKLAPYVARYRPSAQFKATAPATAVTCLSGPEHVCLVGENPGRFRISGTWGLADGTVGEAKVIEFADGPVSGTGLAYFFEPNNIELIVKVLDACGPFGRFWVFVGGLTNVEVFLKVEDTVTGEFKIYHNPLNTAFQPIQDTNAFTCH